MSNRNGEDCAFPFYGSGRFYEKESSGMAALWGEPCLDDGAVGADLCRMGAVPLWEADRVLVRHDPAGGAPVGPAARRPVGKSKLAVQYAERWRHELLGSFFVFPLQPLFLFRGLYGQGRLAAVDECASGCEADPFRLYGCYASGCLGWTGLPCGPSPCCTPLEGSPCCSIKI